MKFQPDQFDVQTITAYGPGWISVDADKITSSVIISSRGQRIAWDCSRFEDLAPAHFAHLAELDAEVVIFGIGSRNRFPPPAWLQPLMARRMVWKPWTPRPPAAPTTSWPARGAT